MKIDRLLGITIYLLNRGVVSKRALAERFEVSERTIQRDIDALGAAGIPVMSERGAGGGYGILEGYRLDRQIVSTDDYIYLIAALKGLCSGYGGQGPDTTLEKLLALAPAPQGRRDRLRLDFRVLQENSAVNGCIASIEQAMDAGMALRIEYTNSHGNPSAPLVEPLALTYRWYAWYLFAYHFEKQDYRLYRLSRIDGLAACPKPQSISHGDLDALLQEQEQQDTRSYLDLRMRCSISLRHAVKEAFPGCRVVALDSDTIEIHHRVPECERMWLGSLMSFGSSIEVLSPMEAQRMRKEKAKEILHMQ